MKTSQSRLWRNLARSVGIFAVVGSLTMIGAVASPAPANAATFSSNCGIVTCSIYADRQTTRTLNHYFNTPEVGVGVGLAQAAECKLLGLGGAVCTAASLFSVYDVSSALRGAVENNACLQFKHTVNFTNLPVVWFTWSSNGTYCKDGTPPFPDGTLIKRSSQQYVYVVYGGAKFLVPNPTAFSQLGYSWSAIRTVSDSDFRDVPFVPAQGTILREYTLPTVYRVENGHKRSLSLSEYTANNYGRFLHFVPDGTIQQIPG